MIRSVRWIATVPIAFGLILASTPSALAECDMQQNRWPLFAHVAPSAKRIVVGTVFNVRSTGFYPWFDLRINQVLRGSAPDVLEIRRLKSGLPLVGSPACRQSAVVYARDGEVIAIAFDGKLPGASGRVSTAAWIKGELPPSVLMLGTQQLTLADVHDLSGLPPTATENAALPSPAAPDAGRNALLVLAAATAGVVITRRLYGGGLDIRRSAGRPVVYSIHGRRR